LSHTSTPCSSSSPFLYWIFAVENKIKCGIKEARKSFPHAQQERIFCMCNNIVIVLKLIPKTKLTLSSSTFSSFLFLRHSCFLSTENALLRWNVNVAKTKDSQIGTWRDFSLLLLCCREKKDIRSLYWFFTRSHSTKILREPGTLKANKFNILLDREQIADVKLVTSINLNI
jgi:hypothetical protein